MGQNLSEIKILEVGGEGVVLARARVGHFD